MPVESMADTSVPKMRVLIAVAPVDHTCGHLVKVSMSASGGSKQMNDEFIRMTGPLMSSTIVETKQLAALLSTTVTDASANIASLNCDDFSVVNRRMGMITSIIENYCVKHKTVDDLHKYLFSVGKSGVQSTFAIPHTTTDVIAKNDGNADAINHQK
ncbi:hypothetical protein GGF37_000586 [Kickxella alabastrina]|nr:hypothetical protein GGF37_000586 [Kickxella alabastrina]